ncbi:MAG: hypothetical protein KKF41_08145 [Actinobacteria bacterium]|nr:hypothetical protein [Actinomycetota bacterium]MBU1943533.1 hypothetical protein [Actinomycetota bacterium]MBU2687542.1 hypothetical protein [Actinomycetota bacterium]
MDEKKRPVSLTVLAGLLAFTGLATALFWILFFAGKMEATETEQDEAFERAFPVADSWMIGCCLVAARNILKMNRKGFFAGAAAGSALMFLACMDILYSLENGKYRPLTSDRAQMLVVNLWTVFMGTLTLATLWKNRDGFRD